MTLLAAIVVLGVVILVHELGHLMAAKAVGVGVIRFSIGFGPATPIRFRRGKTEYVVAWIPLGGYVMMASEDDPEEQASAAIEGSRPEGAWEPDQLFERKPLWARFLVIAAGVLMNAVFAWAIYVGIAAFYGQARSAVTALAAVDTTLLPEVGRPLASLTYPRRIVRLNGDSFTSWDQLREAILRPSSDRLLLQFEGEAAPVLVPLAGARGEDRVNLFRALRPLVEPRIGRVVPGGPAARAGLKARDLVLAVDGDTVVHWEQFVRVVENAAGESLAVSVARGDSVYRMVIVPGPEEIIDPVTEQPRTVGRIGVVVELPVRRVRFGLGGALAEGTRRTVADAGLVIFALRDLVVGRMSPRELGGPIFVGQVAGELAGLGLQPLLAFIALFSINLAVLNLLPIPVLDGGRLVFLLAEGIRGRPLSRELRMRLSQVGVAFLLAVMALAIANDLLRLVGR
ncbi:MAG: zinc metalloprotease [Gemmatimonadales bacterium]|nr:Putative zinc metalloprotease [bacterium HR33]GIW50810.1 MAG: zinc metalloprotease [Gemmatimonadales bacterium]